MEIEIRAQINKLNDYKFKSNLEKRGVSRDLEIVWERLSKGEYQKGFFSASKFDISSRTQALFREMEFLFQLGHDWEHILKAIPQINSRTIVDLCPGFTPKIELGLFYLQFRGKVSVIDVDTKSLASLVRFIRLLNSEFKIQKIRKNLFSAKIAKYDLVLGNHIIDDLVINYFCQLGKITQDDFYQREDVAKKIWQEILAKRNENIAVASATIAGIFQKVTASGGYLCLTQYKSYAEKLFDQKISFQFNSQVLKNVISTLKENGFSDRRRLLDKPFNNYKGHIKKEECFLFQKK